MDIQLGVIEGKFADIIWANEPISTTMLVEICEQSFGWKKTTTYTVLSRLCNKGLFQNEKGTVTSLISGGEFHARQSKQFVEDAFKGSLPAFLAAFMNGKKLTEQEVAEIKALISKYREDN